MEGNSVKSENCDFHHLRRAVGCKPVCILLSNITERHITARAAVWKGSAQVANRMCVPLSQVIGQARSFTLWPDNSTYACQ